MEGILMLDHSSYICFTTFSFFPSVVPIIPVMIPLAVDLSGVVSDDLVIRRPTKENGQVIRPGL